ncbi:hypothetical protein J6590_025037 [Homalodisca vitripennis]|nr:hypothetical protein J6590_025037 [Homalodisca vitripennis]
MFAGTSNNVSSGTDRDRLDTTTLAGDQQLADQKPGNDCNYPTGGGGTERAKQAKSCQGHLHEGLPVHVWALARPRATPCELLASAPSESTVLSNNRVQRTKCREVTMRSEERRTDRRVVEVRSEDREAALFWPNEVNLGPVRDRRHGNVGGMKLGVRVAGDGRTPADPRRDIQIRTIIGRAANQDPVPAVFGGSKINETRPRGSRVTSQFGVRCIPRGESFK